MESKNIASENIIMKENSNTCSICFDTKRKEFVLKCKHSFCKECIFEWCKRETPECPLCRHSIVDERIPEYIVNENSLHHSIIDRIPEEDYFSVNHITMQSFRKIVPLRALSIWDNLRKSRVNQNISFTYTSDISFLTNPHPAFRVRIFLPPIEIRHNNENRHNNKDIGENRIRKMVDDINNENKKLKLKKKKEKALLRIKRKQKRIEYNKKRHSAQNSYLKNSHFRKIAYCRSKR